MEPQPLSALASRNLPIFLLAPSPTQPVVSWGSTCSLEHFLLPRKRTPKPISKLCKQLRAELFCLVSLCFLRILVVPWKDEILNSAKLLQFLCMTGKLTHPHQKPHSQNTHALNVSLAFDTLLHLGWVVFFFFSLPSPNHSHFVPYSLMSLLFFLTKKVLT